MRLSENSSLINRNRLAALSAVILLGLAQPVCGYSVLTHEAIIDTLWIDTIQPVLLMRFPNANEEQLREAHAHAYGGCLIQDLRYYPFGSHFFTDLTHYVRSADFVIALLDESRDLNEYAFALGAVAHYGADVDGHSIAVNRAVPLLYPKLRRQFGNEVTYADNPRAHLRTEFGFDVLQVARGHLRTDGLSRFCRISDFQGPFGPCISEDLWSDLKRPFWNVGSCPWNVSFFRQHPSS